MKPHRSNAKPMGELARLLNVSKNNAPSVDAGNLKSPATVASLIATGNITRERCCDGKKRYRTFEFADQTVKPVLEKQYNKTFTTYACCFCSGWHLATETEFAA
jgi:hypothetical protein